MFRSPRRPTSRAAAVLMSLHPFLHHSDAQPHPLVDVLVTSSVLLLAETFALNRMQLFLESLQRGYWKSLGLRAPPDAENIEAWSDEASYAKGTVVRHRRQYYGAAGEVTQCEPGTAASWLAYHLFSREGGHPKTSRLLLLLSIVQAVVMLSQQLLLLRCSGGSRRRDAHRARAASCSYRRPPGPRLDTPGAAGHARPPARALFWAQAVVAVAHARSIVPRAAALGRPAGRGRGAIARGRPRRPCPPPGPRGRGSADHRRAAVLPAEQCTTTPRRPRGARRMNRAGRRAARTRLLAATACPC